MKLCYCICVTDELKLDVLQFFKLLGICRNVCFDNLPGFETYCKLTADNYPIDISCRTARTDLGRQ